jgi:Fe-S cluster assembly scaffold protein SufB
LEISIRWLHFYLKSRGIGPLLGRKILTYAFAAEILEELPYPASVLGWNPW